MKKLTVSRETVRSLDQADGGIAPATGGCNSMKASCGELTCMFGFCYTNSCPDRCLIG